MFLNEFRTISKTVLAKSGGTVTRKSPFNDFIYGAVIRVLICVNG